MLTPSEADNVIAERVVAMHRQDCPLAQAHGRVLRVDLKADRDQPPYDRVTLDGYALRSAALAAGERRFQVGGVQAAGMRPFKLGAAATACLEVMTGAALPEGADCVVPYEDVQRAGDTVTVTGAGPYPEGHAIHRRGSDHRAEEIVVRAGTRLTGREIAVAAACGHATLTVTQLPKIAVVSTGDELVEVDMPVAAHQVRRSNDYALRAALIAAGYPEVSRFHLRDVPHEIEHLLWHILAEYDAVVLVGGVSKGKFDFVPQELARQGVTRHFHGVAQRPGKPMWFGTTVRHALVFALPGNPVSCYTCLHRYVLPALARASGWNQPARPQAVLSERVTFTANLTYFLPVVTSSGPQAELRAKPCPTNTSGDFSGLLGTTGFVELPAGSTTFPAGTVAPFWAWSC
ncbi:molybdopterin molybdotransferase MoeA [Opitutus sp. ER46]|uniref:molybdopterin molybdotransferase MoeA n=1 Tax=Opitutus sp. ER46 TaxID=2161864 RepID=UPI000D31A26D|nr:molybdopterin molybdotransferase MoeA [Opitutus sp. ER46]PTX98572.1 molybdopterin molybdenumtransferase MoeA [Opitutus sp. ER46]